MATRSLTRSFLLSMACLLVMGRPAQADDWQQCHRSDVKALRFITVGEARLLRQDCNVDDLLAAPMRLEFSYQGCHELSGEKPQ